MKRFLSILSAVFLIVALSLNAVAAITQEDCNTLIDGIGLISTKEYSGDRVVLREEFATVLAEIIGLNTDSTEEIFENLYAMKAIGKDANGSFRENEPLSYDDAILGLLNVAGYSEIAASSGGYPRGYEKIALRYNLTCTKTGSESLTYNDMAQLIYKTMYLPTVETVYSPSKQEIYIDKDKKVMTELFDMEEEQGILSACGEVNLYSQSTLDDDMIALDGVKYKNTFKGCDFLLGKYVTVFFKVDRGERTAVFAYEESRNKVTVISSEDNVEYRSRVYTYYKDNKKKRVNVESNATFLYNGHLPEKKADMVFVPENGWIEFIDNDANNAADIVKIYNYSNYYITGLSAVDEGMKVYAEGREGVLVVNGQKSGNTDLYSADGGKFKYKQLAEGIVVSVFGYKKNGVLKAESLYASQGEIRGFLSGIDSENLQLAIDEVYYYYDKNLQSEIDLLSLGTYRSFYLDFKGKLAYVNYEVADDNNKGVGYVIETAPQSRLNGGGMEIKIYDSSGVMRILNAQKKLYVDGVLKKGNTSIEDALTGKNGMVAYTMYNDGRIRSIDFPSNKQYRDNLTMEPMDHFLYAGGGTSVRFRANPKVFGANMMCNDGVKIIVLPENPESADDSEFDVCTVLTDVFRDDGTYSIQSYSYNNNGIGVDYIVHTREKDYIDAVATIYVVKEMRYQLNEDGDYVPLLQLIGVNGIENYTCSDGDVMNNVTAYAGTDKCTLQKGDIIKIGLNMKGNITKITMVNDASDRSSGFKAATTDFGVSKYFSSSHIIKGNVYDKANGIALITQRDVTASMEDATNEEFEAHRLSLFKIIKVDSNMEVSVVKPEEVKAYKKNNGEYSEVIVALRAGTPSVMVIYE